MDIFPRAKDDVLKGMVEVMLGGKLGSGAYRSVFELAGSEEKTVVKIEYGTECRRNAYEWLVCNEIDHHYRNWIADCNAISANGRILIQERLTTFCSENDPRLPDKIPRFMNFDTKIQNWGLDREGNPKCADYSDAKILIKNPYTMVKPTWWSWEGEDDESI